MEQKYLFRRIEPLPICLNSDTFSSPMKLNPNPNSNPIPNAPTPQNQNPGILSSNHKESCVTSLKDTLYILYGQREFGLHKYRPICFV
jgi:hypothetical protein